MANLIVIVDPDHGARLETAAQLEVTGFHQRVSQFRDS
jgi:hypothetical protein